MTTSSARAIPVQSRRRLHPIRSIFPQKLWIIINNSQYEAAIRWSDDGKSIIIQEKALEALCLGKDNFLFNTKLARSFVRQLHLYGFRKISPNQFIHECFRRGHPTLIERVRRQYRSRRSISMSPSAKSESSSNQTSDENGQQSSSVCWTNEAIDQTLNQILNDQAQSDLQIIGPDQIEQIDIDQEWIEATIYDDNVLTEIYPNMI